MLRYPALILVVGMLAGCTVGKGLSTFPTSADTQASPPLGADDDGSDYRILIANGLSETITLVERHKSKWTVRDNFLPTGQSPSQMIFHDGLVYLVNSLSNSIQIIDPEIPETVREISTGAGTNPIAVAFIDENTLAASCYLTDEVIIIDMRSDTPPSERIIARVEMPPPDKLPHDPGKITRAAPGGLVVTDNKIYVVCSNLIFFHTAGGPGVLVEIDIENRRIDRTWPLTGRDTTGILHSPRFPRRLVLVSAGDFELSQGFVGSGAVESFDLDTHEIFQLVQVGGSPFEGVIGPNDILYLENAKEARVLRVDLHEGVELDGFPLPDQGMSLSYASSMLALPGLLLVTDFNSDRLYIVDPYTMEILAELATGEGPDAMALID